MPRTLLLALFLLALAAPAAHAQANCRCTTYQSVAQFVQFNDVIFKGKALSAKTEYGVTATQFQVLETLKGEPAATVAVSHPAPGTSCGGVAFKPGQTALIVAQGLPEDLATTSCQLSAYPEADLRRALGK
ncbi:MAG: hypothetical protein AB7M12_06760 [Hyphomonadaceae bacterium]